jgi:hypothetical protein
MKTKTLAEKITENFFRNPDDLPVQFSEHELEVKKMYETVFARLLEDPDMEDKLVINTLRNEFDRSLTQAYRDLTNIKTVLGNVSNAKKEWHLYTVIKMCKEAYALAKDEGKIKEMIMAADKLGKYTKLDKDDLEDIDWDAIIPPSFEPSPDPSLLNIPNIPDNLNEYKRKLRARFIKDTRIDDAEIVDYEQQNY